MKIGIVTVHDSANFGSFLQAYALQKILIGMKHEVTFILTRDKKYLKSIFLPGLKNILRNPIKGLKLYINGYKKRRCFLEDQKCFKECSQSQTDGFDLILLGSDEIWNVKTPVFTYPVFYGTGMTPPVFTYAVSSGSSIFADIQKHNNLTEAIKKISELLVRDENTAETVYRITGKTPDIVCDPTLLLDVANFKTDYSNNYLNNNKYIMVYSYLVNNNLRDKIIKFAREKNFKIVSPCFYHEWADKNITCGPLQFCSILEKAEYVITTTFHGTIFSMLMHKQFLSFPAIIKTSDILKRIGLENRITSDADHFNDFAHKLEFSLIDYIEVEKKIAEFRKFSLEKLKNILSSVDESKDVKA